ncbi:ABC1 kinase family protein [Rhodopirellula europaea]|jgi:ubiquinone biosynthesis protein|uniref:Ubiquinone biosynthesis protein UbiB n=1 Tax=Rhodopirellula europaea SH398 TaxID=1263868 RepID=M5S1D7_9BACT|nr:AarF/ABC1/UbiB kinase family protein [Rhodopirellula europaea]EMI25261.1 ubiquinone biosynthesis protein UbiB [Rhodopirellula europaea SH398]
MELIEVPQLIRNAERFREVVTILTRHGLADWMSGVPSIWPERLRDSADESMTTAARIRVAFEELGTTFIKLGQVLSTREDLVGRELACELAQLRANTPSDPADVVIAMIESELGAGIDELFLKFDSTAMASASIGQVHRATTHEGHDVVVKVQHPGIEQRIVNDLEIMQKLAEIAEQQSERLTQYRPVDTIREFHRSLMRELDFQRELKNMNRFRTNFQDEPDVHFAKPYPKLSSRRVLTMQRLDGISVSNKAELKTSGTDLNEVAHRGAVVFLDMIFRDGFYHADPHPGNLMVLNRNVPSQDPSSDGPPAKQVIGLLDCGMVGRIDDALKDDLEVALIAAVTGDAESIAEIAVRLGDVPCDFDEPSLVNEIHDMLDDYSDQKLREFDVSACLRDVTGIIREHRIYLPAKVAMLLKVLAMLEGTAHQLDPNFSLAELLEPYGQQAMRRRLSPRRVYERIKNRVDDWDHLLSILPKDLGDVLHSLKQGNFDIHLQHRRLEPIVNRLVMGILTAALFVGSASLWSSGVPPLLFGVSVPGMLGCSLAIFMGVRLSWQISRVR